MLNALKLKVECSNWKLKNAFRSFYWKYCSSKSLLSGISIMDIIIIFRIWSKNVQLKIKVVEGFLKSSKIQMVDNYGTLARLIGQINIKCKNEWKTAKGTNRIIFFVLYSVKTKWKTNNRSPRAKRSYCEPGGERERRWITKT